MSFLFDIFFISGGLAIAWLIARLLSERLDDLDIELNITSHIMLVFIATGLVLIIL